MNELTYSNKMLVLKMLGLLVVMVLFPVSIYAQKVCFNYKGSWSSWEDWKEKNLFGSFSSWEKGSCQVYRTSDCSNVTLKTKGGVEFFDFQITNYTAPDKKVIKAHRKRGEWYEYRGTVSYYVNDDYPTAEALSKACKLVMPDPRHDVTPQVKRTAYAKIKIAPYKKHPKVYNIWFDNIGVGIDLSGFE